MSSPGRPLDASSRRFFESRFSQDFGHVRLHTGAKAEESARAIRARAYTAGQHVVFGRDQYREGSAETRRLLAHELTHVVQQRSARAPMAIGSARSPAEHEADDNARRIMAGESVTVGQRASVISRACTAAESGEAVAGRGADAEGCEPAERQALIAAFSLGGTRICGAVDKLWAYTRAPSSADNAATREALQRHFHTTDTDVALQVYNHLSDLSIDMGQGRFEVECHDETDSACDGPSAYLPGAGSDQIIFCPVFFEDSSSEEQAGTVVHEVAHANEHLDVLDRAYQYDRMLPLLTTEQALRNAESYEMLVRELATGRAVTGTAPEDEIEDCSEETTPLAERALAEAQRWNADAENFIRDPRPGSQAGIDAMLTTHLGNHSRQTRLTARRIFKRTKRDFRREMEVRCHSEPESECSGRTAYGESGDTSLLGLGIGTGIGAAVGIAAGIAVGFLGAFAAPGLAVLAGIGVGLGLTVAGASLGYGLGLAFSSGPSIHVCPAWSGGDASDRTETVLSAAYEGARDLTPEDSDRYAALARAVHEGIYGETSG